MMESHKSKISFGVVFGSGVIQKIEWIVSLPTHLTLIDLKPNTTQAAAR